MVIMREYHRHANSGNSAAQNEAIIGHRTSEVNPNAI